MSGATVGEEAVSEEAAGGGAAVSEHVDVLIIGAGLSGIGAAHHIQTAFPGKTYTILEARDVIGGTWDLFRYPGVRSDSDMFTLGYRFRPWLKAEAIADGASILDYVRDTATAGGIEAHIRFNHRVTRAAWSTAEARWTVEAVHSAETVSVTCNFLLMCSGYYRYDHGYLPQFAGIEDFRGQVVHPQHWPQDLDYAGKRVVVIGSGATAVTLVPALAADRGARDDAAALAQLHPDTAGRGRHRRPAAQAARPAARVHRRALEERDAGHAALQAQPPPPEMIRNLIRKLAIKQLPAGLRRRHALQPDLQPVGPAPVPGPRRRPLPGDHAQAVPSWSPTRSRPSPRRGLLLESGAELAADIVVTATGLQLLALGGAQLVVDDRPVSLPETMAYKGMMLSGVPNFAFTIGYTNASWTLKADLVSEFVCRLLGYMDSRGYAECVPVNDDPSVTGQPLLDFSAGYVLRAIDQFPGPARGPRGGWA